MFGNNTTDNQSISNTSTTNDSSSTTSSNPVLGLDSLSYGAPLSSQGQNTAAPADMTMPSPTPLEAPQVQESPVAQNDIPEFIPPEDDTNPSIAGEDDLLTLKRDALEKLIPIVDKLDQTPAEKFKTTMMMIQASDDKTLVPKAYEAANAIEDEKTKAQALLDIINEINYFTNHSSTES